MTKKKPVGERIRDLLNPILEDSRKPQEQLNVLNGFFRAVAIQFPKMLEAGLRDEFNRIVHLNPDEKFRAVVEHITAVDPQTGAPKYSPILRMGIPVFLPFTDFTSKEVKEQLPDYIFLHEAARAENVSIKILTLLGEDVRATSGLNPAILIIDGSKTYNEGAKESAHLYPNLPELPDEFDQEKPKGFEF